MKYHLFDRLPFFQYIKSFHIEYHPGRKGSDVCRQIINEQNRKKNVVLFGRMEKTRSLLGYNSPSYIEIEFSNGVKNGFCPDGMDMLEVHNEFDRDQYKAHMDFTQKNVYQHRRDIPLPRSYFSA
eukprot:Filipodium_phascolosomae@DN5238_c0_g1_i1.p1